MQNIDLEFDFTVTNSGKSLKFVLLDFDTRRSAAVLVNGGNISQSEADRILAGLRDFEAVADFNKNAPDIELPWASFIEAGEVVNIGFDMHESWTEIALSTRENFAHRGDDDEE